MFAVLAAAGAAVWYLGTRPAGGVELKAVEADIARDLPAGTSREDVRAWLAGRGYTDVADLTNAGGKVDGIQARIPNDTWFDKADIVIQFRFDGDWKLQRSIASRLYRD